MKCPVCNAILQKIKIFETELDFCSDCKGCWFDKNELTETAKKLIDNGQIPNAKIDLDKKVNSVYAINEKKRKCPKCSVEMEKINYAYDSNVFVDKCNCCGGIWTDCNELHQIAVFIKGNPTLDRMGESIAAHTGEKLNKKYAREEAAYSNKGFWFVFMPRVIIPISDGAPRSKAPLVVASIILLNCIVFALQNTLFHNGSSDFFLFSDLVPADFLSSPMKSYSIISSMFVHADFFHLIGNMLFLWIFADNIEDYYGHFKFIVFYLFCGACASVGHLIFHYNSSVPLIGASGAVAGTMGAYFTLYPDARVKTYIWGMIKEIPAFVYLGLWISMQILSAYLASKSSGQSGIAWYAHIAGFSCGALITLIAKFAEKKNSAKFADASAYRNIDS